jgi:hypothetical protein
MADIDIVPKHRSRAWLWMLLAIVALIVLWLLMDRGSASTLLDPSPVRFAAAYALQMAVPHA